MEKKEKCEEKVGVYGDRCKRDATQFVYDRWCGKTVHVCAQHAKKVRRENRDFVLFD